MSKPTAHIVELWGEVRCGDLVLEGAPVIGEPPGWFYEVIEGDEHFARRVDVDRLSRGEIEICPDCAIDSIRQSIAADHIRKATVPRTRGLTETECCGRIGPHAPDCKNWGKDRPIPKPAPSPSPGAGEVKAVVDLHAFHCSYHETCVKCREFAKDWMRLRKGLPDQPTASEEVSDGS